MRSVPIQLTLELSRYIRLLAKSGQKYFIHYLKEPLEVANWTIEYSNESAIKLQDRINHSMSEKGSRHMVPSLCKKLVCITTRESLSALGDACLFFLDKISQSIQIANTPEAEEFLQITQPPLFDFREKQQQYSQGKFEASLATLSQEKLQEALRPIDIEKASIRVNFEREALNLFQRISSASRAEKVSQCRSLLSRYLIRYGDKDNNNRTEVEKLIDVLDRKHANFRKELYDAIAIDLYYMIVAGITEGNLRKSIKGIRKYAFIFQGNPNALYFLEIDSFEGKLYHIIRQRNLLEELKK